MPKEQIHQEVKLHSGAHVDKLLMFGKARDVISVDGVLVVYIGRTEKRLRVYPFTAVDQRVLGPAEGPILTLDFEPTREEYISKSVHFPHGLIKTIDDMLEVHREALVIGEGASGKTVLAYGYGIRHQAKLCLALYLDCKDHLDALPMGEILDVVETWRSPELLLLIDNVHIIPEGFEQLRRALRNLQAPSRDTPSLDAFSVLYFGRRVACHLDESSRTIDRMERAGRLVRIKGDRDAFRAVHTRLCLRHNVAPPSLPDAIFKRWVNDFAGDLTAFAVAAQSLGTELANPNVTITPKVALDNIRRRYLDPLSTDPDSYWNLLLLCAMAELELVAHRDMFKLVTPGASPFPVLIEEGVVYVRTVGVDVKYDLFHPSMGSLILHAAQIKRSRASILAKGCSRRPSSIVHILMRLYDLGLFGEAKELESVLKRPDFFFSLCSTNLKAHEWHKLFRVLDRSTPDMFLFVEEELRKENHLRGFVHQVVQSPLQFVSSLIRYLKKRSPDLAEVLEKALLRVENQEALLANALERPLADLSLFLTYAEEGMPEVAQALTRSLSKEVYRDRLLSKMLEAELHFISRFLQYADRNMQHVAPTLKNALANEYHQSRLLERCVQIQPHLLAEFMEYADESLPQDVGRYLKNGLTQKEYRDRLLNQALSTELWHLKIFFQYANRAMPKVAEALQEGLAREEHRDGLLNRALESPLHDLGRFLKYAQDDLPEIVQVLDRGLASEEYRYRLLDRALRTDLHLVGAFLRAAKETVPRAYRVVKSGLSAVEHRAQLLMCAADTPLGDLKAFCSNMDVVAPEVSIAIKDGLADERYLIRLRNRALETPLDHLASFLRYADTAMPTVSKTIKDWLAEEENRDRLVARGLRTPTKNMRGFLNYAEWEMPELVAAIKIARAQRRG